MRLWFSVPSPRVPEPAEPQHQAEPSVATPQLQRVPPLSMFHRKPAVTVTGAHRVLGDAEPVPSSPLLLRPQHLAWPSAAIAQAFRHPSEI